MKDIYLVGIRQKQQRSQPEINPAKLDLVFGNKAGSILEVLLKWGFVVLCLL